MVSAFATNESGAVTVDWVVLTAAIMTLNLVVIFTPAREAITGVLGQVAESIGLTGQIMQESNSLEGG